MGPLGPQGPKGEDQQDLSDQEDLKANQDIKGTAWMRRECLQVTRSSNTTCHCNRRKRISRGDPGLMGKVTQSGEKYERIMMLDQ